MEFAKLFTLNNGHQVLYEKGYSNEDEDKDAPNTLAIVSHAEGVRVSATMGFETQEELSEAFDTLSITTAQSFFDGLLKEIIS